MLQQNIHTCIQYIADTLKYTIHEWISFPPIANSIVLINQIVFFHQYDPNLYIWWIHFKHAIFIKSSMSIQYRTHLRRHTHIKQNIMLQSIFFFGKIRVHKARERIWIRRRRMSFGGKINIWNETVYHHVHIEQVRARQNTNIEWRERKKNWKYYLHTNFLHTMQYTEWLCYTLYVLSI